MEGNYSYLALAIDSTSLKVFRPHGIESYLGNSCETPGLRKFAMNRPSLVKPDEIHYQSELASKRGCVERFFKRLKKSFSIFSQIYRWDHSHFNIDFDICVFFNK
ncbi:hypothetical protein A3Q56_08574 [Intoshia linei]|uniref:Uncharacterized protein n=1 Tax=Intoshia linei TaxID=1819745 RepID=A0A177ANU2_9BILA|nr:hypothetical protein A3Q56_08574 [Intoshia linei]